MRKVLTVSLLIGAFFVLWVNFAQAGEPEAHACVAGDVVVVNGNVCADTDGLDGVLGNVGDTVEDALDEAGDLVGVLF